MNKMNEMNEYIQDVEFEEIYTEQKNEFSHGNIFDRVEIQSTYFGCCAFLFSNFGIMNSRIWWGYKLGYYSIIFPIALAVMLIIDIIIMITVNVIFYFAKKIFDMIALSLNLFVKILMCAIAILVVALFVYNQGWNGLNDIYNSLCEFLKNLFG